MSNDMTFCCNTDCENKNKCKRFKTEGYGKEYWFAKFNPRDCEEKSR